MSIWFVRNTYDNVENLFVRNALELRLYLMGKEGMEQSSLSGKGQA